MAQLLQMLELGLAMLLQEQRQPYRQQGRPAPCQLLRPC
jgi:hypothetical protein